MESTSIVAFNHPYASKVSKCHYDLRKVVSSQAFKSQHDCVKYVHVKANVTMIVDGSFCCYCHMKFKKNKTAYFFILDENPRKDNTTQLFTNMSILRMPSLS